MQRAYVYKMHPTRAQAAAMERQLTLHCRLYNAALEHRRTAYKRARVSISYAQQNRELTLIRADDPEYRAMASSAEQRTLRRLDRAFAAFFRRVKAGEKPGYPRFKPVQRFTSVEFTAGSGARVEGNRAYFQGVGSVKFRLYRPLGGEPTAITFSQRASGWWLIVSCRCPDVIPEPTTAPAVGVDVGLRHFVALSDGTTIEAPRPLERGQKRLRRAQRALSRAQRGSNRRQKTRQRLARQHERIVNQRRDFAFKTARQLVGGGRIGTIGGSPYGVFVVEALDLRRMAEARPGRYPWARHGLNRGARDAAWRQFLTILDRRAAEAGGRIVSVPAVDTTQTCSRCGATVPKTIFEPLHQCGSCGLVIDQDVNAARVILSRLIAPTVQEARRLIRENRPEPGQRSTSPAMAGLGRESPRGVSL